MQIALLDLDNACKDFYRAEAEHPKFKRNQAGNPPSAPKYKCWPWETLKSETVMGIVSKRLSDDYPEVQQTFYITKASRHLLGIEKSPAGDAFVIAGGDNSFNKDSMQH